MKKPTAEHLFAPFTEEHPFAPLVKSLSLRLALRHVLVPILVLVLALALTLVGCQNVARQPDYLSYVRRPATLRVRGESDGLPFSLTVSRDGAGQTVVRLEDSGICWTVTAQGVKTLEMGAIRFDGGSGGSAALSPQGLYRAEQMFFPSRWDQAETVTLGQEKRVKVSATVDLPSSAPASDPVPDSVSVSVPVSVTVYLDPETLVPLRFEWPGGYGDVTEYRPAAG